MRYQSTSTRLNPCLSLEVGAVAVWQAGNAIWSKRSHSTFGMFAAAGHRPQGSRDGLGRAWQPQNQGFAATLLPTRKWGFSFWRSTSKPFPQEFHPIDPPGHPPADFLPTAFPISARRGGSVSGVPPV